MTLFLEQLNLDVTLPPTTLRGRGKRFSSWVPRQKSGMYFMDGGTTTGRRAIAMQEGHMFFSDPSKKTLVEQTRKKTP